MKESTMTYARETWTDQYEDDEYDELLMECYQKCQLPKKPDQTRHHWQCLYCKKVFQGRPGLNYHRHKGCPTVGHCLKMYPILRKGQRLVVKGLLGKRKCFMNLRKEDGKLDTLHNVHKLDIVPEMNTHAQELFAMAPASTLNALSEVRGKSCNSGINHLDTMDVPEGTKTSCLDGLPTVPMNCKDVEVEAKEEFSHNTRFAGEKHGNVHQVKWKRDFVHEYYTIEDKEWNWSPAFLLLKDSPLQSAIGFRCPWHHTIEEWLLVMEYLKWRRANWLETFDLPPIVLALKATWHFHFGPASYVSDIMLSALKDTLVCVSEEKGFGNELSWTQTMMCESGAMFLTGPGLKGQEQQLANDIASFKAPLESPVHQEVVKRLFDCFVAIAHRGMEDMACLHADYLKVMWIGGSDDEKEKAIKCWRTCLRHREDLDTGFMAEHHLGNSVEMVKAKAELRSVMQRAVKEINCSMVKVSDRHQVLNGEVDSCGRDSLHNTVVGKNLEKLEHSQWGKGISQLDSVSHAQLDTGRKLEDINLGTVESTLLSKTCVLVGVGTEDSDIQFEMQDSCVVGNHKPPLQNFSNTINGHKWVESAPTSQTYAGREWGMPWNNEPNILNHEVIFFKGTHLENALRISALTPLTCEHGMVNDELMFWFFAYYQTYGPQKAFKECHIANSFTWKHLTNHVLEHGTTEASLKTFVEKRLQCGITEASQFNTFIVPINDSQHWSLMILEREKYYHMNSKPDYDAHNNLEMKTLFAKCWEIMQGNYDEDMMDAPNHQRKHNKWVQTNVPTQKGSWECGWFVFKYFVMYLEQRFVKPKSEGLELVQFTEDWFDYDDAIAMQRWLVDAIHKETCEIRVSVNPLRIKGHALHREFEENTGSRNLHDYGNAPQMKAYTQTSLAMGLPNISDALLGLRGASSGRAISSTDTMDVIEGTKTLPVGSMDQELLEVDYNGWDF